MSHLHFKFKQAKVLFYQQLTLFYPFEKVTKQVGKIPLSNNTVKRIMDEISKNKKEQLISALNKMAFIAYSCTKSLT